MPIRDYRDKRTASFVEGERVRAFEGVERQAGRAIAKLQSATRLMDLRYPPSNRFEALGGNRRGEYSIRINDRWRVCFRWAFIENMPKGTDILTVAGEPYSVEITDHYD
jgi:proteic killer suppression protein